MFLAPRFFLGGVPPKFLDLRYKIRPDSDHVAKFQGDRSRELRERVANKKRKKEKHHEHFISPPVTTVNGRPNNASLLHLLTGGVTGVHTSKDVCVLRANNFNRCCTITKLIGVDIGNRI